MDTSTTGTIRGALLGVLRCFQSASFTAADARDLASKALFPDGRYDVSETGTRLALDSMVRYHEISRDESRGIPYTYHFNRGTP